MDALKNFSQIGAYIDYGISVIPVRDKQDGMHMPKTPYRGWKEFQFSIIDKPVLFSLLDNYNTSSVAIIGGKVSGNLEIIDIDVKNWPGIDARFFSDLNTIYPALFKSLRIHKSPSGGFHILYRVEDFEVPGNKKLAYKDDEKSTQAAIETRGEGGYVLAPPSLGYDIFQNRPIPTITKEERESIIGIAQSYNLKIAKEKTYVGTKKESDYYSENPFESFNGSVDAGSILCRNGWEIYKDTSHFIWFTRPGKKNGVSASFNKDKRVFYIFTSSVGEFEPSTGYNPSTVLAILEFGGDRKKTFQYLVEKGYGKINATIEKKIIKSKAIRGDFKVPENFSDVAKKEMEEKSKEFNDLYPHGTFWKLIESNTKCEISVQRFIEVSKSSGFRLHLGDIVKIEGKFIHRCTQKEFFNYMKSYIKEEDADDFILIHDEYEKFLQKRGQFLTERLDDIEQEKILSDDRNTSYKFFKNGFMKITASNMAMVEYDNAEGLIFFDRVQDREFTFGGDYKESKYYEFLNLSVDYEKNKEHIKKIIGYLCHDYKDETTGYIITLTEKVANAMEGGGSGKNIFCKLLRHSIGYHQLNGETIQYNEKFLQSWGGQRVVCISDPDKHFKWSFLKEAATGSIIVKKLFKDEVIIPVEQGAKFVIPTNFSYEATDGGLKRRIVNVEFTDFFTKCGGIDNHFGCYFPTESSKKSGWDYNDWQSYDYFIFKCVQEYIESGCKLKNGELSETGFEKQFKQQYGELTHQFIVENVPTWVRIGFVTATDFNILYDKFSIENNINIKYKLSSVLMNKALQSWCDREKIIYEKDAIHFNQFNEKIKSRTFKKPLN